RYVQCAYSGVWSKTYSKLEISHSNPARSPLDSFFSAKSYGESQDGAITSDAKPSSHSYCVRDLCSWIEHEYFPLVLQVLGKIDTAALLSDIDDAADRPVEPSGDTLVELAILLNKGSEQLEQRVDE